MAAAVLKPLGIWQTAARKHTAWSRQRQCEAVDKAFAVWNVACDRVYGRRILIEANPPEISTSKRQLLSTCITLAPWGPELGEQSHALKEALPDFFTEKSPLPIRVSQFSSHLKKAETSAAPIARTLVKPRELGQLRSEDTSRPKSQTKRRALRQIEKRGPCPPGELWSSMHHVVSPATTSGAL